MHEVTYYRCDFCTQPYFSKSDALKHELECRYNPANKPDPAGQGQFTFDSSRRWADFINMDCMDALRCMPDKCVDMAIVDPPYGINAPNMNMGSGKNAAGTLRYESTAKRLRKGRLNECEWDYEPPTQEYFDELFRVSVNQIIFGGNYFDLPPTRGVGCWDKKQPWENFSQWEMMWTSFDCPAFMIRYSTTGGANREKKIHPVQKPVPVYKELLKKFAKPGDKILDTHVGSASSLIACHECGFEYLGFEKDTEYFTAATERLGAVKSQITLWEVNR